MTLYDSDQSSKHSSENIANESPQRFIPYEESHRIQRRPSVFSTTQSIESIRNGHSNDYHPLKLTNSRVDQECEEAASKDAEGAQEAADKKTSIWQPIWQFLWVHLKPDFISSHLDWQSFKIVSKTWLVTFISILMISITPVLRYMGPAGYIMIIASCIEIAGGITVSHAIYSAVTDSVFIMFAFMCNVISHAINWRIRGYPTSETIMLQLVEQGICKMGDAHCMAHELNTGRYLSTKTTIITMFGMFFSLVIAGYLQTKSSFFMPPWILSAICSVIIGVYLNFTPYFAPWFIGKTIIIPFCFAFVARVLVAIFYFPISSNRKFFSVVVSSLKAVHGILDTTLSQLAQTKPSNENYAKLLQKFTVSLPSALQKFALLELEGIFSRGEFAYSRSDPGDLGEFRSLVRMMVNTFSGCRFYFDHIAEKGRMIAAHADLSDSDSQREKADQSNLPKDSSSSSMTESPERPPMLHRSSKSVPVFSRKDQLTHADLKYTYEKTGNFEDLRHKHAEKMNRDGMDLHDLDVLHESIMNHYADSNKCVQNVINVIADWAEEANKYRIWSLIIPSYRKKRQVNQRENSAKIKHALEELKLQFDGEQKSDFKEWSEKYCRSTAFKSRRHYLYCVGMDSFYGCSLERVARSVQRAATYCLFLDDHQPEPKWIFPFMRTRSKAPRFEKEYMSKGILGFDVDDTPTAFQPTSFTERRNPDSSPPRTKLHLLGRKVSSLWAFLNNPTTTYITKRALLTVLSCLTYYCRTSAFWSYRHRVIWVPIMVSLTVTAKAVDGAYGFIMKITFTFAGSLAGMVIWYIGNGHGDGNPYGFTVATSAMMAVFMCYRHFHKLLIPMGPIVMCVTSILVSATSWVDSKTPPVDIDLGKGFRVAWIRFVEVSAALLIAFIGTLLPHPVTAKKEVRVLSGSSLELFGDCQTSIANFAIGRQKDPNIHILPRQDIILQKLRRIKVSNLTVRWLTRQIRYEPPLGGVWPRHKFQLLTKLIWELSFLVEDIFYFLDDVKSHKDMRLILQLMGWTNVESTSGLYSVLVSGSRALYTGNPLPSVTPGHLSDIYTRHLHEVLDLSTTKLNMDVEAFLEERYLTHDGRSALAMILTSSAIFERADGCIRLIKELVGEIYDLDMSIYTHEDEIPLVWTSSAN